MRELAQLQTQTQMGDSFPCDARHFSQSFLRGDRRTLRTVESWIDSELRGNFRSLWIDWEDLKQEATLRVVRNLSSGGFEGRSSASTYVIRIVRNVCIDSLRQAHRHREVRGIDATGEPAAPEAAPEPPASWTCGDLLQRVLARLTETELQMVHLVYVESLSYVEVARRLGIAEGTVKSRMSRIKERVLRMKRRFSRERR